MGSRVVRIGDVAKPTVAACLDLGTAFVLAANHATGTGMPYLYAILTISAVTFGARALKLAAWRHDQHTIELDSDAFAPERVKFLGVTVATFAVIFALESGQGEISAGGFAAEWVVGLLTTVPLLDAYGSQWGKLRLSDRPKTPVDLDEEGAKPVTSGGASTGETPAEVSQDPLPSSDLHRPEPTKG